MKARHTVIGWIAYEIGIRVMRRWLARNRTKIAAGATVGLVLVGGILAAKATDAAE